MQVSQKVHTAMEGLQKAVAHVSANPVIYGNCYIMVKHEKMGIVWQQFQTKQLAAFELSQTSKMMIDTLFQKVTNYAFLTYKESNFYTIIIIT